MEEFFVIEITTKQGPGFVIDGPKGIQLAAEFIASVKQFTRKTDANEFSEKNKLHKYGSIRIVPNSELMGKFGTKVARDNLHVIENQNGQRLFFDTKTELYYFEPERKVGCCCWYDKQSCNTAVNGLQKMFQDDILKSVKL